MQTLTLSRTPHRSAPYESNMYLKWQTKSEIKHWCGVRLKKILLRMIKIIVFNAYDKKIVFFNNVLSTI